MKQVVVFSTSVEVFRCDAASARRDASLLHVRGGVSTRQGTGTGHDRSSPRPWRCFSISPRMEKTPEVFSTSVEVFPATGFKCCAEFGLLHVRGGVSKLPDTSGIRRESSPRPWRCFSAYLSWKPKTSVFSTSVEVFPTPPRFVVEFVCLLHVRGGVSVISGASSVPERSSPRPWRCF